MQDSGAQGSHPPSGWAESFLRDDTQTRVPTLGSEPQKLPQISFPLLIKLFELVCLYSSQTQHFRSMKAKWCSGLPMTHIRGQMRADNWAGWTSPQKPLLVVDTNNPQHSKNASTCWNLYQLRQTKLLSWVVESWRASCSYWVNDRAGWSCALLTPCQGSFQGPRSSLCLHTVQVLVCMRRTAHWTWTWACHSFISLQTPFFSPFILWSSEHAIFLLVTDTGLCPMDLKIYFFVSMLLFWQHWPQVNIYIHIYKHIYIHISTCINSAIRTAFYSNHCPMLSTILITSDAEKRKKRKPCSKDNLLVTPGKWQASKTSRNLLLRAWISSKHLPAFLMKNGPFLLLLKCSLGIVWVFSAIFYTQPKDSDKLSFSLQRLVNYVMNTPVTSNSNLTLCCDGCRIWYLW